MAERYDYTKGQLLESEANVDPFQQFSVWLEEATQAQVIEPTAMCLSTVADNGKPSSRIVLLRSHGPEGFTFFTNYESRKGHEIKECPLGCLNFWWGALERQIRIEGVIEQISEAESDDYWYSRPFESQVASAASPQSQTIEDRESLNILVKQVRDNHTDQIPRPPHWGGYRMQPDMIEFWQGGPARLHDRLRYQRLDNSWQIDRLAP